MGGPLFFEKEAATLQFLKTQLLTNTWQFESQKCQFNCVSVFLARSFAVLECADARQLRNGIITRGRGWG